MSFANQPSRLLISSDDLSYGTGNSFTCTLPEPITGAVKADLLRAVIPNTGYQIPPYQSKFYYYISTVGGGNTLQSFTINVNQYIDGIVTDPANGFNSYFPLVGTPAQGATRGYLNSQQAVLTFTYNEALQRIIVAPRAGGAVTIRIAPQSVWTVNAGLRAFALNTRCGFTDANFGPAATSVTAQVLPNLIRSKVVYVLCNVVMNDSITTDGLRTAISKIPVNSSYGGLTIYQPPMLNWNRLITQGSYQSITIELLDDQYQPYPLQTAEFCEFEIIFKYDDIEDGRMRR
jgi:hypothetical protein